jgi:prepilin-type N-terminal cleavage/methylation domain-containing protein
MKNRRLGLTLIQHLTQKKSRLTQPHTQHNKGFTLLEVLVVVIMIAILSAIAAPGWLAFVQQRRASSANGAVFRALQKAQSEAKNTKLSYSVSVRNENNIPEIAVHQTDTDGDGTVDVPAANSILWTNLGEELGLKSGQVTLYTNIDAENSVDASTQHSTGTITFDYLGALPVGADTDLKVVAAATKGDGTLVESSQRCVTVKTLLGSLQIDQGADCNN